jgi:hypothetical protein
LRDAQAPSNPGVAKNPRMTRYRTRDLVTAVETFIDG